jgi:hypothetical protein
MRNFLLLLLCLTGTFNAVSQTDKGCIVALKKNTVVITKSGVEDWEQIKIQINAPKGDYASKIYIPYSQRRPAEIVTAQIETLDGTVIRELKTKDIVKRSSISSFSLYEDDMVYTFELHHNMYPYIVHFEYKTTYKNYINLCDWSPVYDFDLPTKQAILTVSMPKEFTINAWEEKIGKPQIETIENTKTYQWTSSYAPVTNEPNSVNKLDIAPHITVTTNDFFYGIAGKLDSWQNFGKWYTDLHKDLYTLTPYEQEVVDKIAAEASTDKEKIDRLYHHLQTTKRYINVSIDLGGIKSQPAQYVCTNGYGDCKALSNYMKALLMRAGIQSNIALVYGDEIPIHPPTLFPCDRFNHVILCVPNKGDTTWLECTSPINPTGYLGAFTQNRYALLIDENNSKLVKTPKLNAEQCLVVNKCHIALNGDTKYNFEFNGPSFEEVKSMQEAAPQSWHEYIFDHYLMPSFDAKEWKFESSAKNNSMVKLEIKGNWVNNQGALESQQAILTSPSIVMQNLPKSTKRQTPIYFPYPTVVVDTTVMEIGTTFAKLDNAPDFKFESKQVSYTKHLEKCGNTIKITRKLVIPEGQYPPEMYNEIWTNFQTVKKADKERLIVTQ